MAKVSIQDMARAIANKHGLAQSEAENFVTALFDVLNEGLHKEKIVKVKGLGTFKVIDVRERESVNVNTGERVLIDSHGKITFTPDPIMRDLVNKPFAQFETVILNEGVDLEEMSNTQGYANDDTDNGNTQEEPNPAEEQTAENDDVRPVNETVVENIMETDEEQDGIEVQEELLATPLQQEEATEPNEPLNDTDSQNEETDEPYNEYLNTVKNEGQQTIFPQEEDSSDKECNVDEDETYGQQDVTHAAEVPEDEPQSTGNNYAEEKRKITQTQWAMFLVFTLLFGAVTLIIGYYWGASSVGPIIRYKTVHILNEPLPATVEKDTLHIIDTTSTKKATAAPPQKEETKTESKPATTAPQQSQPMLDAARAMVRTGAYNITGTTETITVKKGETLKKISKFYLGDGMECYIQVHNGITEVKEGMKLKIPKLQVKKKK